MSNEALFAATFPSKNAFSSCFYMSTLMQCLNGSNLNIHYSMIYLFSTEKTAVYCDLGLTNNYARLPSYNFFYDLCER